MNKNQIAKGFKKQFGFGLGRDFNDISFDAITGNYFSVGLGRLRRIDGKKFLKVKEYILEHKKEMDKRLYLLAKAHISYVEENFEKAVDLFFQLVELYPTDIDSWIELTFALLHTKDNYDLALDVIFNLYHYIHYYQKYNFHTINLSNLKLLMHIVKNFSEYPNNYIEPTTFQDEFLIVSRECNNNCTTCPNIFKLRKFDLKDVYTTDDSKLYDYIYHKIREKHIKNLIFTGGEPTILPNFFDILNIIFKIRPEINLILQTNGRMFSLPEFIKKFERFKKKNILFEVGFFSSEKKIHDRITRCEGSFEQTVEGIINLLEEGYPLEINIVLCKLNYKKIAKIIDWIISDFGKYNSFKRINLLLPIPSGSYLKEFHMKNITHMYNFVDKVISSYNGVTPLMWKNKFL